MTYRVEFVPRAAKDFDQIASISGAEWFNQFEDALRSLQTMPQRCAVSRSRHRNERFGSCSAEKGATSTGSTFRSQARWFGFFIFATPPGNR